MEKSRLPEGTYPLKKRDCETHVARQIVLKVSFTIPILKLNALFFRFELVLTCWKDEPSERPTFESATRSLEEMMQEGAPYLDLESLDESQAYYCSEKLSEDDVTV